MKILIVEPTGFSDEARSVLQELGEVTEGATDRTDLIDRVGDIEILVVRLGFDIDAEIMQAAKNLKCIVSPTTGLDHIDLDFAKIRDIEVLSLRGETEFLNGITPTAELTFGLILGLLRHIPAAHQDVVSGNWRRDRFRGLSLKGRTLGVLGYGRLGRWVASYGAAFGMTILAHDHAEKPAEPGITFIELVELLEKADILTIHLPLTSETRHLIDADALSRMRSGAYLVNTSRGAIVDSEALLRALRAGQLAGAALDVVEAEAQGEATMSAHPLVDYARRGGNVLLTPHIGGASFDAMAETEIFIAGKTRAFVEKALVANR